MTRPAFPLLRATAPLRESSFDVLVVGGGIYGAWTAYDAAARGLSVALIERDDWASGTSSRSSKLIHGGLRYLEHFDFGLVRDALAERRTLHALAPHLVRPIDFLIPVWAGPRKSMFMLSAGLLLYDLLGLPGQPVRWHARFTRDALRSRFPFVDPERLLGGFRYGDCQEDDARLTLTVVAAAQAAGATVANRVRARALQHEPDGRVVGAEVTDRVTGDRFLLRASVTVNAAGPWAPGLVSGAAPRVRLVKGVHVVLPAVEGCDNAFLLTAADGRVIFVIPWYGRALVGTTESEVAGPHDDQVSDEAVRYLIGGVRRCLPGLPWTPADVLGRFAGVRTLQAEDDPDLSGVTREFAVHEPAPGLVMPLGGKFTTARVDAADIVDRVEAALDRPHSRSRTADRPLPGAPPTSEPLDRWQSAVEPLLRRHGVDPAATTSLALRHGERVGRVADLLGENPAWAARIVPDLPFLLVEAVLAARDEMALGLDDVLRRRMPLSVLCRMPPGALRAVAEALSPEWRQDSFEILEEYRRATDS